MSNNSSSSVLSFGFITDLYEQALVNGMTYSLPPSRILHLGKANRPNPCPATPIIHRLHTHIPPSHCFHLGVKWIPTVCQNAPPISGCDSLSPYLPFSCLPVPHVCPFISTDKCLAHSHKHIPREVMTKTGRSLVVANIWFLELDLN